MLLSTAIEIHIFLVAIAILIFLFFLNLGEIFDDNNSLTIKIIFLWLNIFIVSLLIALVS